MDSDIFQVSGSRILHIILFDIYEEGNFEVTPGRTRVDVIRKSVHLLLSRPGHPKSPNWG